MDIRDHDFLSAEAALNKAAAFDPIEPLSLVLLAYVQLMNRHLDEAIASSRKAHALDKPHAFVHRVAANAFEQKTYTNDAIKELELFLREEPTGAQADGARIELERVRAAKH